MKNLIIIIIHYATNWYSYTYSFASTTHPKQIASCPAVTSFHRRFRNHSHLFKQKELMLFVEIYHFLLSSFVLGPGNKSIASCCISSWVVAGMDNCVAPYLLASDQVFAYLATEYSYHYLPLTALVRFLSSLLVNNSAREGKI